MTALLGIDLGTGSVKALIVDARGRTLGHGSAEYDQQRPYAGWAEQRPSDWWQATVAAVREAHRSAGHPRIDAIGLSGQMHGTVLLDEAGNPVRSAIIWADARSGEEVAEITGRIGAARLIEICGSPIAAGFQAASVRWVQKHEPEKWEQVRRILLPKDFLRWLLTGEWATEPSDASSTLLFDVRKRLWSAEILDALSIPADYLPAVVESNAVSGVLSVAAAEALGLISGTPVSGGGADAPLSALAAGVVRPEVMALTVSTGSQVMIPATTVTPDAGGRIHTWCNVLQQSAGRPGWYQMGATLVSGLALRWLRDAIFRLRGADAYDVMIAEAMLSPVGARGLLFLPYLNGERTPHMNPNARGIFLGLSSAHEQGDLTRAVIEGSILALYDASVVLTSLGANPASIVLSGGGAQSPLWRQVVADVFGMAVRPLMTVEQSALGATMLAGSAIGLFDPVDAATSWPEYGPEVGPDPVAHSRYAELLDVFRRAYRAHVDDFERLVQIAR